MMENWDYNCPRYVDFTNLTEDDKDDEYFDVHNDFQDGAGPSQPAAATNHHPEDEGFQVLKAPNLLDLMAGSSRSSGIAHSYALRRTSARRKMNAPASAGNTPRAKKSRRSHSPSTGAAPLLLNKSVARLRRETSDRSLSVPPSSPKNPETRKRHASETTKPKKDLPSKTKKLVATRVQPFRFATDKRVETQEKGKRKLEDSKPYVGLAEQVLAFQNRVPDRFKSIPNTISSSAAQNSLRLTRAVTPRLRTNMRARPTHVVSQEQKEEEEMKEFQKFQFKAKPFDPKIFIHTLGIPMVKSKLPTRPLKVHLATDKRSEAWKKPESEEVFHFKARPVPQKVLAGPMTAKPPTPVPVTQPKSPAFALKLRHVAWKKHQEELAAKEEEEKNSSTRKPRVGSMPPPQAPFEKMPTVPEPFSFDSIDKQRWAKKEQKIKQMVHEKENQHYQFHANPMPSPSVIGLPPKPQVTVTQPEPFQLLIDERGQKMAEQWQQKLEEEMRLAKEAMVFKAKPSTVLCKEPFVPDKAVKPLTESTNLRLNTEKRAEERDLYEEKRRELEAELEEIKAQKAAEEENREKLRIRRMRAQATHKAQPVPVCQPTLIRPSDKPLTKPQSPKFSTRFYKK